MCNIVMISEIFFEMPVALLGIKEFFYSPEAQFICPLGLFLQRYNI